MLDGFTRFVQHVAHTSAATGVLVTHGGDDVIVPLTVRSLHDDGLVVFLVDRAAPWVGGEAEALVTFASADDAWVAGTVRFDASIDRVRRLWTFASPATFDHPDDAAVMELVVTDWAIPGTDHRHRPAGGNAPAPAPTPAAVGLLPDVVGGPTDRLDLGRPDRDVRFAGARPGMPSPVRSVAA